MNKKRILMVGEASFISTGFSTLSLELMSRLYKTGKYELFELGCGANNGDRRALDLPWKFYNNSPAKSEQDIFGKHPQDEFGKFRLNAVLLNCKPNIVCDVRDPYMQGCLFETPFRPFFKLCIMPPIDGLPQEEHWLSLYKNADYNFAYTDWGKKILEQAGIKVSAVTPPGADPVYEMFEDKRAHKEKVGISPDNLIVGTVMRNQQRKLYPDLIESFAKMLKEAPEEISKKALLYLHCAYPDIGWKIGDLILKHGVANKTLMTYRCDNCGAAFPSFFSGPKRRCVNCGGVASTSTSFAGISRKDLCNVYNLFDVYVQYSVCEGLGIPCLEAACCGVPIISVDHSAMKEVCDKLGGDLVPDKRPFTQSETGRVLAMPDNDVLVERLISILSLPESVRKNKGAKQERLCRQLYSYDESALKWEQVLDSIVINDRWGIPNTCPSSAKEVPYGLSNSQFVEWGLTKVAGRPELCSSYFAVKTVRDLDIGHSYSPIGGLFVNDFELNQRRIATQPFTRKDALDIFTDMWNEKVFWEEQRCKQ